MHGALSKTTLFQFFRLKYSEYHGFEFDEITFATFELMKLKEWNTVPVWMCFAGDLLLNFRYDFNPQLENPFEELQSHSLNVSLRFINESVARKDQEALGPGHELNTRAMANVSDWVERVILTDLQLSDFGSVRLSTQSGLHWLLKRHPLLCAHFK